MKLYMIRHGETEWNKEQRLQGRSDVPLNEYGIYLAKETAKALKDYKFDEIYSSPLIRAYTTAEIIKGDRNINIVKDSRLTEMSFGDYEGKETKYLTGDFRKFFEAPDQYTPTPNGESFADVMVRAKDFIDNVIIPKTSQIDSMLIVAHGALINGLNACILNKEIKDYWTGIFPRNCCMTSYEVTDGYFDLLTYGDIFYKELAGKRYK